MRKNTSPARTGADRRGKFSHLTCQPQGWEARWSKVSLLWNQNELTNENHRIISIHLTIPVVFRLYGKISPHPGEIPPLVRWDFTLPVVISSSCKRKMKKERFLSEGGIPPLSPGPGKWGVLPHINRPLEELTKDEQYLWRKGANKIVWFRKQFYICNNSIKRSLTMSVIQASQFGSFVVTQK